MEEINIFEITQLEEGLEGIAGVARQAENALGSLDNKLLSLRLNFGKLRAAIERAFAPITSHVATALNGIVRGLTDFVNDAGAVIAALFGTVQEKAVVTSRKTGKALRRSLADFDEIQRLNGGSGGSAGSTVTWKTISQPLTPELQRTVDAIRAVLAPLQAISFSSARAAFAALGAAIADLGKTIGESLLWAWHNLLVPLAQWTIEAAVPAAVNALSAAFSALNAALAPVLAGIRAMAPAFQPVVSFIGQTVTLAIAKLEQHFQKFAALFSERSLALQGSFRAIGECIAVVWKLTEPVLTALRSLWGVVLDYISNRTAVEVAAFIDIFSGLAAFVSGVFTGSWSKAWGGVKTVFKGFVNGIIGLINAMLSGLVGGINAAVKALNRFRVDMPDWLPGVGGKRLGFSLPTLAVPQIPYLAKGAVLPANAPFLAVVGDQKHGTNIEAPLSVIQEAVAAVLLPGQNESNQLLAQLLGAVSGIRVGDETIGRAAQRYQRRQLKMEGGF